MSAEAAQAAEVDKKLADTFSADVEAALRPLADKYKGKILDFAIAVNWEQSLRPKPFPKLIIETLRDAKAPDFDPIRQALELNEILNLSGVQVMRNILFHTLQQMGEASKQIGELQEKLAGK
jgi:hypothetical protein